MTNNREQYALINYSRYDFPDVIQIDTRFLCKIQRLLLQ